MHHGPATYGGDEPHRKRLARLSGLPGAKGDGASARASIRFSRVTEKVMNNGRSLTLSGELAHQPFQQLAHSGLALAWQRRASGSLPLHTVQAMCLGNHLRAAPGRGNL